MSVTSPALVDSTHAERAHVLAEQFIAFLETGKAADGLLAPDVFFDVALPTWRLQASGAEDAIALRVAGHPDQGTVPRWRFDPTPTGFVLEFEEAWDAQGGHWTAREMLRADISDEGITQMSVYCTGDWDAARRAEHAAEVTLIRP